MRNIVEYPITKDEMIAGLEELLAKELASPAIGSLRPVILSYVIDALKNGHYMPSKTDP